MKGKHAPSSRRPSATYAARRPARSSPRAMPPGKRTCPSSRALLSLPQTRGATTESRPRRHYRRHRRVRDHVSLDLRLGPAESRTARSARRWEVPIRNWYYYTLAERRPHRRHAVHCASPRWPGPSATSPSMPGRAAAARSAPTPCTAIFTILSVGYEYPDDVRGYHNCRHWPTPTSMSRTTSIGTRDSATILR